MILDPVISAMSRRRSLCQTLWLYGLKAVGFHPSATKSTNLSFSLSWSQYLSYLSYHTWYVLMNIGSLRSRTENRWLQDPPQQLFSRNSVGSGGFKGQVTKPSSRYSTPFSRVNMMSFLGLKQAWLQGRCIQIAKSEKTYKSDQIGHSPSKTASDCWLESTKQRCMFSPSWTAEYTISFRLRMCKQVSRPLLMPQSKPQKWQSHSNHSSLLKNIPIALWRYWTSVAKKGITPKRHRLKMAQIISAWEGVVDSFQWPLSVTFVNSCRQSASDSLINNFLTGTLSPCVDVRALCWICLGLSRTRVWVGMNDEIPQSQKQCMNPSQKKCHICHTIQEFVVSNRLFLKLQ